MRHCLLEICVPKQVQQREIIFHYWIWYLSLFCSVMSVNMHLVFFFFLPASRKSFLCLNCRQSFTNISDGHYWHQSTYWLINDSITGGDSSKAHYACCSVGSRRKEKTKKLSKKAFLSGFSFSYKSGSLFASFFPFNSGYWSFCALDISLGYFFPACHVGKRKMKKRWVYFNHAVRQLQRGRQWIIRPCFLLI